MAKYIFITGGVVSGLGKGICAASLGRLLKQRGLKVLLQKFDPYLNVDPGTMSPYQHGEVFVTDDGAETDLDLGHYERFVDENLTGKSSVSSGKVYWNVLSRERRGDYLGATIQIIPHITDEIKSHIYSIAEEDTDVVICEIGGTVGDIESQAFLESIRQVANDRGRENVLFIHVPLIVKIPGSGELKSKPVQHSVKELLSIGIQPDILVCRSDEPITDEIRKKISLFCNIEPECVIQNLTAPSLYQVPLYLEREGLDSIVCRKLGLSTPSADMEEWKALALREEQAAGCVSIALVGKYVSLHDAYLSVVEALNHGGTANGAKVKIKWVDSELLTDENTGYYLDDVDGIIVPGGFGDRGIEGMISAIRYAREKQIPYFGICLGMQMAVVEFARHVAGLSEAHSAEFVENGKYPVIALMEAQKAVTAKGGTMRLGRYPCKLSPESLSAKLYGAAAASGVQAGSGMQPGSDDAAGTHEQPGSDGTAGTHVQAGSGMQPGSDDAAGSQIIYERHRHRFELNNKFRSLLENDGLKIAGQSPDGALVEIVELPEHPWFVGVQFHPEFTSRPNRPQPLFVGFINAALKYRQSKGDKIL